MAKISVICKERIERTRIDSEFYLPRYLQIVQTLKSLSHSNLGKFCLVTSGTTPPDRDDLLKEGIILLKTRNIQEGYIDLSDDVFYINKEIDDRMKSTRLKPKDILLNIVGATLDVIGRVAIIPSNFPRANITQAMALIRLKKEARNIFFPEYVFAFLYSKYGRMQVCRLARPTGQFNINHQEVRTIIIPKMTSEFQLTIVDLVNQSIRLLEESRKKRFQAEKILLTELQCKNLQSQFSLTYVTNLSDCIENKRIDSEFYRPEYKVIFNKITEIANKNSWEVKTIKDISEPLKYGTSEKLTYLNKGVPFLRITDVQDMDFDKELLWKISQAQASKIKYAEVKEGDLVISRSGTLGLSIPIRKNLENSIFGSYFIRIRPKMRVNRDYLALFLNSFFGQIQVKQMCTGAVQTNLTIPIIEKIKVLLPSSDFQERIAELLVESRQLREKSRNVLKKVKDKIETKIEKPWNVLLVNTQSKSANVLKS